MFLTGRGLDLGVDRLFSIGAPRREVSQRSCSLVDTFLLAVVEDRYLFDVRLRPHISSQSLES